MRFHVSQRHTLGEDVRTLNSAVGSLKVMSPHSEPSLMERFGYGVTQNLFHVDLQRYFFSNRSPLYV